MADEVKKHTTEEIDKQIKDLIALRKQVQPQSSYEARPLKEKLAYDLQPIKLFTSTIKILLVVAIIGLGIYGYGYYKGKKKVVDNTPVQMQLKYGKEQIIQLNKEGTEFLHITKTGEMHIQDNADDSKAKIHYKISVKDVPALWEKLKPYGFDIRPFVAAGGSIGASGVKQEVGIGMQWYRFYKAYLNSFITTAGVYPLGISYKLTENFDALGGVGLGYEGDYRFFLGGKMRF